MITKKQKTRLRDIIKRMVWLLEQRNFVKELDRFIWKEKKSQYDDWRYKDRGVPMDDFEKFLYKREIISKLENPISNFLLTLREKFNDKYILDFYSRHKALRRDCHKDGYIDIENGLMVVSPKGKRFISIIHNIWDILQSPFILRLIEFGVPVGGVVYIIKLLIEKL